MHEHEINGSFELKCNVPLIYDTISKEQYFAIISTCVTKGLTKWLIIEHNCKTISFKSGFNTEGRVILINCFWAGCAKIFCLKCLIATAVLMLILKRNFNFFAYVACNALEATHIAFLQDSIKSYFLAIFQNSFKNTNIKG